MPIASKNINAEKIQGNLDVTTVTASYVAVTNDLTVTGSITVSGSITGSAGVINSLTASNAVTASYAISGGNQNLQSVTNNGNITENSLIVSESIWFSEVTSTGVSSRNTSTNTYSYLSEDGNIGLRTNNYTSVFKNDNVTKNNIALQFPDKPSGSYTIATTTDLNSYVTTSSFNAYTGSSTSQFAGTASFATIANAVTELDQAVYISGSLTVVGQSTFYGTASFVEVTASNLFVSESFISVNVFEPVERFGGLKVYDSGSSTATASLAWDSFHNHWVYQDVSGSTYAGGMLISGPRNTGSLGDEPTLTKWLVPRSDGGDHLDDSQIFTSGSTTQVTGSLTVTAGVTASFTGSYVGDGAGLYNIPASGIVGLNLSQIVSGSASASISPADLQVNVPVIAPAFTGSLHGTASVAIMAVTASYIDGGFY